MPQPENAFQTNDERYPERGSVRLLMRWLVASPKQARRFLKWLALGVLVTSALGAAANHFISGTTTDQVPTKTASQSAETGWNGHPLDWWSGGDQTSQTQAAAPLSTAHPPDSVSPKTPPPNHPGAAFDHAPKFSFSAVNLRDSLAPIGSNNAAESHPFAGPAWMRPAPLTANYRPPSLPKSGKFSNKTTGASVWESPITVTAETTDKPTVEMSSDSGNTETASSGGKGIPVNHEYQLTSSELYLTNKNETPTGAKSSAPAYAILGLGKSSTPDNSSASVTDVLHFSLAGQLDTVPTMSISDDVTPLVTPEPGACLMLLAGGAMLLSRRRRPNRAD